jgi:hypothetical protein
MFRRSVKCPHCERYNEHSHRMCEVYRQAFVAGHNALQAMKRHKCFEGFKQEFNVAYEEFMQLKEDGNTFNCENGDWVILWDLRESLSPSQ